MFWKIQDLLNFLQKGFLYINLHYAQRRFWHVCIALQDFSYQLLEIFFAWNRIGQPILFFNQFTCNTLIS